MTRFAFSVLVGLATLLLLGGSVTPANLIIAQGVISSDLYVHVKSKVAAPIRKIPVKEGDVMRRSELLVEMANEVERTQVEAAKAEVQRAQSALAEAELALRIAVREFERNSKVPDLITEKDLELSHDAVRTAEATLKTKMEEIAKAEAQLVVAQANYDETFIRAPFDGFVSRVYVRVGDTPKVSDTVLIDFFSLEKLYVEVALPLPHLPQIREGMGVRIEVEHKHTAIKTVVEGAVRYVYPEVDPITRMFRVKIDVPEAGRRILPGMFANVRLDLPSQAR
jgi:RND family efflux transporter MFP subunit